MRSESGDEKSVRGYFENLVEECIQEVSTMEYFRGNSHIVSVEDYKVMEYLDEIGWDIFIRMEYLTSFMEYYAGKNLTEKEVMKLGIDLCRSLEYCGQLHIIHRDIKPENILYPGSGFQAGGLWNRQRTGKNHEYPFQKGNLFLYGAGDVQGRTVRQQSGHLCTWPGVI